MKIVPERLKSEPAKPEKKDDKAKGEPARKAEPLKDGKQPIDKQPAAPAQDKSSGAEGGGVKPADKKDAVKQADKPVEKKGETVQEAPAGK